MTDCIVYHGDARALAWTHGEPADVLITDPPYRDHVHKNATSCGTKALGGSGPGVRARDLGFASLTPELRAYIAACAAWVRRWSIVYSDVEDAHLWREACVSAGAEYIRPTAWIRWSQPQLSGDRPTTGFEILSVFHGSDGGRKHWNGRGNLIEWPHEDVPDLDGFDAIRHKALRGAGKHKTEKPLDQALDLVSYFSDPGELVYDPCAGSGTTGVACALLGRRFVGCELDGTWADKANIRIDDAARGRLSARDLERAQRYLESALAAADAKPPTRDAERPAYERAQRRVADAVRVAERLAA